MSCLNSEKTMLIFLISSAALACREEVKESNFSVEKTQRQVCPEPVDDSLMALEDQAKERGLELDIPYYQKRGECNFIPGGLVAQDLNNDGWVDILFNNVDGSPWAFKNYQGQLERVELGLELFDERRGNLGLGAVDLNGDNLPEIVQSGAGFAVYAENLGDFQFGEWKVILDEPEYPRTCYNTFGFGDMDQDNDLDLALAGLDKTTPDGRPLPLDPDKWKAGFDLLIENKNGEWEVKQELSPWEDKPGFSILQVFTDQDNDGDLDLMSASDRPLENVFPPMAMWRNHGKEDGEFLIEDVAPQIGMDLMISPMGLGVNDLNQDGFLDYCFSDVKDILVCLLSDGPNYYYEAGGALGLFVEWTEHPRVPEWWLESLTYRDTTWSGWSLVMEDLDNDGFLDMATTAGQPPDGGSIAHSHVDSWQPDWLWRGVKQGQTVGFEQVDPSHSFFSERPNYGMASADLDHDGFRELIIGPAYGQPSVFNNPCGKGHWLEIDLVGKGNNREAFGARVVVERAGFIDQQEMNNVLALGQPPSELHFGLGTQDKVDSVTVYWPDGTTTIKKDVTANQFLRIQQGE